MNDKILYVQKRIRFIPYINLITIICWLITIIKYNVSFKEWGKYLVIACGSFWALAIPRIVISIVIDNMTIYNIVVNVTLIIAFYIISFVFVKHQDKIIKRLK